MKVVPDGDLDVQWSKGGRWIAVGIGLLLLVASTMWALAIEDVLASWLVGTLSLVALAAVWLPLIILVFPLRTRRPALVAGYHLGLVVIGAVLFTRAQAFSAFLSIGYPFAFALFPPRWSIFAVATTALLPTSLMSVVGKYEDVPLYVTMLSLAGPILWGGWFIGNMSEKRRKALAELAESNRRLEDTMEENAGLHAQLLAQAREAGVLDERQRLAREIHDTLAQGLAGIITQLQAADRAQAGSERWGRHMDNVRSLAKQSLTEARRSVQALQPEQLEDSHLPEAIADLAASWSASTGIPATVEVTGDARPLFTGIEVTLFRVVQEALSNVAKHAQATVVGLTLSYLDDVVLLDVRDDGVGFAVGSSGNGAGGHGFGLKGMRQRLRGVAGNVEIESTPGEGTAISASVPAMPAPTAASVGEDQ